MLSFLYFGTYVYLIRHYWVELTSPYRLDADRLLAGCGLITILLVGIYGLTDGIKVPFQVIQFGTHGFIMGYLRHSSARKPFPGKLPG